MWYQTHSMYDIIWILCDITTTLNDITGLYSWYHIHTIHDITPSVYDISYDEWMTTQQLYLEWYPMYLCNPTDLIDDITHYVRMKSQPLHVWHHRHFIEHHIPSCWQHTIVCMSWHTLCLWHHICHPYCVYDYPSFISDLKLIKTAISYTLYVITHSVKEITPTVWDITGGICMPSYALYMTLY